MDKELLLNNRKRKITKYNNKGKEAMKGEWDQLKTQGKNNLVW